MTRSWPRTCLALLALLATLPLACKPEVKGTTSGGPKPAAQTRAATEGPPFVLSEIHLNLAEGGLPPDAPKLTQVRTWVRQALLEQPEFTQDTTHTGPRVELRGSYRAAWEDAGDGSGQRLGAVFFELHVQPTDGARRNRYEISAFVGEALKEGQAPQQALRELVREVSREVTGSLARQARAEHATDQELVGFLSRAEDLELLKATIPEVRERRLRAAAGGLQALLKHPEREIVNLAAGALGDTGDRSAVPALIEAGSRVEPADRLPVIYALGALGGPDATSYLEALRSSDVHPSLYTPIDNALKRAKGQ